MPPFKPVRPGVVNASPQRPQSTTACLLFLPEEKGAADLPRRRRYSSSSRKNWSASSSYEYSSAYRPHEIAVRSVSSA